MLKHLFFDLDDTLTPSRTEMQPEYRPWFKQLCNERDVIVVSGAEAKQIRAQIPESIGAKFYLLSQTGNHCISKDGKDMWKEAFTLDQTAATHGFIEQLKAQLNLTVKDPNDLVEDRGSQISYSPIGHHESLENKRAFDPSQSMRRELLAEHAKEVEVLQRVGVDVVPGGTTCFDFFLAGRNKGFNVHRLFTQMAWQKDDCVYVGDALFPGGNDQTVIGVIPTHAVKNSDETFDFIKLILKPS